MNVGMIGLGKLGLPVAVAMAHRGAKVRGYDLNEERMDAEPKPELELGPDNREHYNKWLKEVHDEGSLIFCDVPEIVAESDLVFIAVQTPHDAEYEGITPLPFKRKDFNYDALRSAVSMVCMHAEEIKKNTTLVIISTCLPGTMRQLIVPLLDVYESLVYNPYFIAMGTTMHDFLYPDAVLVGSSDVESANKVINFYDDLNISPVRVMGIESAELAKVAYNTWISAKLSIVNTLADICHKTEADVDEVTQFLQTATGRIVSPEYMTAGMGDGGGCHPRDNIALSWLANRLGIHFDMFDAIMREREEHARWLANMLIEHADRTGLPKVILGYTYKPETNLTIGSHALLVKSFVAIAGKRVSLHDEHVDPNISPINSPAVFLIGCKHPEYASARFPSGSVVIDPWRYIPNQEGVKVIRIGQS